MPLSVNNTAFTIWKQNAKHTMYANRTSASYQSENSEHIILRRNEQFGVTPSKINGTIILFNILRYSRQRTLTMRTKAPTGTQRSVRIFLNLSALKEIQAYNTQPPAATNRADNFGYKYHTTRSKRK